MKYNGRIFLFIILMENIISLVRNFKRNINIYIKRIIKLYLCIKMIFINEK